MTEVFLFPIPNLISFPGTLVPLHVFEPRYRDMIKTAVKNKKLVGVTHTKKILSEAGQTQSLGEKLQKNQDTYEPQNIFSAGFCEIKDVTPDGRMMVEIKMEKRYKLKEIVQNLPYQVALCELYDDQADKKSIEESWSLKNRLDTFLINNAKSEEVELKNLLLSDAWKNLPIENYSFSIFQLLRFPSEEQQSILEMDAPNLRLQKACELLNLV